MAQSRATPSVTLRDYLQVVWLRKWLVLLVVAACTVTAFLVSYNQTRMYSATALLMFEPPTNIANPLSTGSSTDVNDLALELQSVINTLDSQPVATKAHQLLNARSDDTEDFTVAGSILAPDASSGASVSDTVAIQSESTDALRAAEVANAYAQAVIDTRLEAEQARLGAAQDAVRAQMDLFQTPASKLSTDYLLLAQRQNDLQVAEATATGDFKVVRIATAPTSPATPKPLQAAVVGFVVGLFAGVALAFIAAQFDTRVRTHRDAGEVLGLPVIGRLPLVSKGTLAARNIPVLSEPDGAYAESIRMLRSSLVWAAVGGEWKSLLVTSGRQGEGKSMTLCNVAVALALTGKKVVLVDADLRAPVVHRYFDLSNVTGLTTVLARLASVQTELTRVAIHGQVERHARVWTAALEEGKDDSQLGSLHVLTSGPLPPHPGELAGSPRLADVVGELVASDADYVLIDGPPLLGVGGTADLARLADGLLFVVSLKHSKRPLLEDSRDALAGLPCRVLGAVFLGDGADASSYYRYEPASSEVKPLQVL